MARLVEFRRLLDADNALRVRFELEQGKVIRFMVQFECVFDAQWTAIVRYDNAHGYAHQDTLHPFEPETKSRMPTQDNNVALTMAMGDLRANWRAYRRRYEQWLQG